VAPRLVLVGLWEGERQLPDPLGQLVQLAH
jgi:hypothetical protein